MARSCGIRLGPQRYEIVALEGTPKKLKVLAAISGEIPPGEDPVAAAAEVLRAAVREYKLPVENVGLVVGTGLAAFRNLTLPFADRSKIEEVIKFEVESQLPQWNIDEVVIDFLDLSSKHSESQLLVTAVPKALLKPLLDSCERAGFDALEAELEASAVVNAAHQAGLIQPDAAQILVNIGEESTSVVVLDGGRLRSMRAIHIGALPPRPAVSEPLPAEEGEKTAEKPAEKPAAPPREPPDPRESAARLRRELVRTIMGMGTQTEHPLQGVYLSGLEMPGLLEEGVLGVPVRRLEPFAADEARAGASPSLCAAAFGAALARLDGGMLKASLRREELHYAGRFERLELPLAVAGLLLVALLSVYLIITWKQIDARKWDLQKWIESSNNYMLGDPKKGAPARLKRPSEKIKKYALQAQNGEDAERTLYEQMINIRNLLSAEIRDRERDLGQDKEIVKPQSALEGLSLVLAVVADMGEGRIGRVGLREMTADYTQGQGGKPDTVSVKINASFYAENAVRASENYNAFQTEIQSKPWCVEFPSRGTKELEGKVGIYVEGMTTILDLNKAPRTDVVAEDKQGG